MTPQGTTNMGEKLSEANRALIERVLGHEIEPDLARTLGPSTLAALLDAARAEGPHPGESGEWVMVPREPCVEMISAWYRTKNGHHFHDEPAPTDTSDYAAYRAMIAASPPPPKGAGKPEDGSSQGLGGHPCGERDGADTERAAALAGGDA